MADAKQKRNEQLKRWIGSETDQEPPLLKKKKTKVKFDDGAVFLAACSSGDTEEVLRMIDHGADINYANVDGLTALHQVCFPPLLSRTPRPQMSARPPRSTCQMEAILLPLFTFPALRSFWTAGASELGYGALGTLIIHLMDFTKLKSSVIRGSVARLGPLAPRGQSNCCVPDWKTGSLLLCLFQ